MGFSQLPPSLFPLSIKTEVLLITYDLKTPGRVYTSFFETLKHQGQWWHYLSSTWLIASTKTPQEVYSAIAPHLTMNDFVLIVPITRPYHGFLPKEAWEWIEKNLPKI